MSMLTPEQVQEQEASQSRISAGLMRPRADRLLPWSGIATGRADNEEFLTSQQMLVKAGLDWDVAVRPLWIRKSNGEFSQHPRAREVYRTDTEDTIGVVKSHYQAFPNREAFAFGDNLLEDGAIWAEAGMQGNGFRVFMTMKIGEGFTVLGEDAYNLYMFLRTGHDGSSSVVASIVPFRVFCLNQNEMVNTSFKTRWSVQHTTSLQTRAREARESLKLVKSYEKEFKKIAEKLASVKITDEKASSVVRRLIPERRSRRDEIIADILSVYRTSPNLEPYRGTAYGLLNGVTEYMDHIKRQRNDNARFEAIMWGEAARARRELARELAAMS